MRRAEIWAWQADKKLGGESHGCCLSLRLCPPLAVAFWQERMNMAWQMTQLLLLVSVATAWGAQSRTPGARRDLLNVCMDAKHHKTKPGPEDKLHDQVRMEWGQGLGRMEEVGKWEDQFWGAMESRGWLRQSPRGHQIYCSEGTIFWHPLWAKCFPHTLSVNMPKGPNW